jgi:hypothetical protein
MNHLLKKTIDYCYTVICRHCGKKVLDPDKDRRQKYLDDNCPSCGKNGQDPVESVENKEKEEA